MRGSESAPPLGGAELALLRWLSEQQAARLDQLAGALDTSQRTAQGLAKRLEAIGLVERRRFLADQPSWLWLTGAGQRACGSGIRAWQPALGSLAHLAAVNDVRLHIQRQVPAAVWVSERMLARARQSEEHLPDGVVLLERTPQPSEESLASSQHVATRIERHAIEVELTQKSQRRLEAILDDLSDRFDAVVYFCAVPVRASLERYGVQEQWPKLVLRDLPAAPKPSPARTNRDTARRSPSISAASRR